VVSQAPPAGARAAQRTAVNVTLSLGPRVAVPPLVGKNVGDATTILRAAGLVLVSTRVEGAPGIVMQQEPAAGTLVSPGSEIQITIRKIHATAPEGAAWADSSDVIGLVIIGGRRSKIPPPSSS
jgi:beta-lactam-binding protein with PASTA domain